MHHNFICVFTKLEMVNPVALSSPTYLFTSKSDSLALKCCYRLNNPFGSLLSSSGLHSCKSAK